MKLFIKDIKIKNFLSIGSVPIHFDFNKGIHAITGKVIGQDTSNGVGKSAIATEAITYALYGKCLRNLNQSQIINSINGCDCYVTLRFSIDNTNYRIERGLKPNFLNLINEDIEEKNNNIKKSDRVNENEKSNKKLTQTDIDNIINLSYSSFINLITLNINFSTSFFEMKASEKRDFLENILNLSVYGDMFINAKKDFNELKKEFTIIETELKSEISSLKEKVDAAKKIQTLKENFEKEKQENISNIQNKIQLLQKEKENLSKELKDESKLNDKYKIIKDKKDKIIENINELNNSYNIISNDITHLNKNFNLLKMGKCPTCKTEGDTIESYKNEIDSEINEKSYELETLKEKINKYKENKYKATEALDKINELINKNDRINSKINNLSSEEKFYSSQLKNEENRSLNVDDIITKEQLNKEKYNISNKKDLLSNTKNKMNLASRMKDILGDKGIKNYTIRKLLPNLNKKMNYYLSVLNANYTISFNSELKETLKSRNRDVFVYENFSSGEKKRIDLAWMLTMFEIARLRNSVDCNILVLDEVLDSSMCMNGIDTFMKHLKTDFKEKYPNMCVYIITHKSEISEDDFNSIIKLKKENHFTKIDEIIEIDPIIQV